GELLLSKSLADSLQARPGDHLQLTVSRAAPADFKVAAITMAEGPGAYGGQPAVFGTLAAMTALTGSDLVNVVRLSAFGEGPRELDNSKRISQEAAMALVDLPGAGGLQVRTVKADDVNEVMQLADQNRPVTLALSSIIVLAGIAMVVNLALALAEERRPRLAILRALGLSRADLILATVLEGSIYSLAAAAIGALPGIAVGWLLVSQAGRWVPEIHEKNAVVVFVVSTEAVAISIAAGTLVTLTTLVVASIRTTRLTIASAVRAMPDPPSQRRLHRLGSAAIVLL